MERGGHNPVSEGGQRSTSGLPIRVGERLAVAVVAGEVTEEEDRNFVAAIEERHREGTFFRNAIAIQSPARNDESIEHAAPFDADVVHAR